MLLVRNEVEKLLSVEEECLTLEEQMPALFEWLRFFDTNRMVLMILLVGVGAVNLLSALFILILERQQSIGILQTLGLRPAQLSQTLVFLGMRLVIKGMLIGNLGMGLIYMAQNRWKFFRLDPESYYLDFVPLKLDIPTWFMINGGAMAIAFFLLWISAFLLTRRYSDQNLQFT
jgi:lipoprotein-releasing system permease protein